MNIETKWFSRLAYLLILVSKNNEKTVQNFRQINEHLDVWYRVKRCHLDIGCIATG